MQREACTVVTGAGRGIGRAIAIRMAQEGPVILVSRTCKELEATAGMFPEHAHATLVEGDVRVPSTAAEVVRVAQQHGWRIRNLVVNAGMAKSGAIETFDLKLWKEINEVNIDGAIHFVQACLPQMLEDQAGAIVLMSSVAGLQGSSHDAPYIMTKHAIVGLAKAIAHEHGKHGIVAVPICPGFVESDMTERTIVGYAARHDMKYKEARNRIERVNPQRRIIPAEEIAEAVAFVCSRKVPSMSGHPLILSGGA